MLGITALLLRNNHMIGFFAVIERTVLPEKETVHSGQTIIGKQQEWPPDPVRIP
jgi:hypothetical protein